MASSTAGSFVFRRPMPGRKGILNEDSSFV
nr:MAG TPA: hypothetical protein [Caudoviricetes sp.]